MPDEIITRLAQYITAEIIKQPNRTLRGDEALISSGLIDSFHLVDLATFVEDAFGVHLDDTELNASVFDSLNQLAALIRSRQ
jgi:acyl carrier protein